MSQQYDHALLSWYMIEISGAHKKAGQSGGGRLKQKNPKANETLSGS